MIYEQMVGLEPLPNGTIVQCVNPFSKTYRFEKHTDEGVFPCGEPEGFKDKRGYRYDPETK